MRDRQVRDTQKVRPGVPGGGSADCPDTGKPIAQVARDLGINTGTLGNLVAVNGGVKIDPFPTLGFNLTGSIFRRRRQVAKDRAEREGTQGFSIGGYSRVEAATRRGRQAADRARCHQAISGPVGEEATR
jgi:hypothetical protein